MADRPGAYRGPVVEKQARPVRVESAMSGSLFPGALNEARSAKVHVSLALVIALAAGAFYAGRSSPPPEIVAELARQNERNAANQAETAAQLKRVAESLDKQAQALRDLQELARTTNTEMQFVSSHYKAPPR